MTRPPADNGHPGQSLFEQPAMPCANRNTSWTSAFVALSAILAVCSLTACPRHSSRSSYASDAPLSDVKDVNRVIIPADGGQTIPVPKLMGDAYTLWSFPDKEMDHASRSKGRRSAVKHNKGVEGPLTPLAGRLSASQINVTERYLDRLTGDQRELAARVLARAQKYLPNILEVLHRKGLPAELACLPMVESTFEPGAVSPKGAAGLWQLTSGTARRFGLKVSGGTDERLNPAKATEAATDYLIALYQQFHDWPLAIAAYNCGETAMQKALSRTNRTNLADLSAQCRLAPKESPLREETLNFVPAFAAAVEVMSKSRELKLNDITLLASQSHGATAGTLRNGQLMIAASQQEKNGNQGQEPPAPQHDDGKLRLQGDYTWQPSSESPPPQSVRIQ